MTAGRHLLQPSPAPELPVDGALDPAVADGGRVHRVAVVDTDDELIAIALGFLRAGLDQGDVVVAYLAPAAAGHVRAQLPEVDVRELSVPTPREPDAIAGHLQMLGDAQAEGRRLRVLGQVHERDRRAWDERVRGEAAHEHVFAGEPMTSLCVYDSRTTPLEALEVVLVAHPEVVVGGRVHESPGFRPPLDLLASLPVPEEPLQAQAPVFAVDDAPSLPELRHQLAAALRGRFAGRDAEEDFHLAASEIAANAFRHGGRPVSVRLWAAPDRVVCTISDGGSDYDGFLAGYRPAHGDDLSRGGMGLWLARKLCDHVDLHRSAAGLTVRLTAAVPA
ncbi:sensor histidine kinase [Geodermatophilaceae bacterium NBWT11]|nr:sensor histidine kinase [Geodermatophilaceae bacterium NBWT11]